jgi:hypothetical protein
MFYHIATPLTDIGTEIDNRHTILRHKEQAAILSETERVLSGLRATVDAHHRTSRNNPRVLVFDDHKDHSVSFDYAGQAFNSSLVNTLKKLGYTTTTSTTYRTVNNFRLKRVVVYIRDPRVKQPRRGILAQTCDIQ